MKIKNLLFASMSLVLLAGCDQKHEPEKVFLISKVYGYQQHSRNGEWNMSTHREYKYDKKGNRIEEKGFDYINDSAVLAELITYAYDNAGNETSYDIISYDTSNGNVRNRCGYTYENYDSFGNCGKETTLDYEAPFEVPSDTSLRLCEFDSEGKKTKETTELDIVVYDYYSNGLLKTKTFSDIVGETTELTHKIEYTYYENSNLLKDASTYGYSDNAFDEAPYSKDCFEYDENGFMTLYEMYSGTEITSSMEREIISDVSCKETYKTITPDSGFALASITEKTYSNHEAMIKDDFNSVVLEVENMFDAYISTINPTSKSIRTTTFENGLYKEYISEQIYYQSNSDVESSYSAYKEIIEYTEL